MGYIFSWILSIVFFVYLAFKTKKLLSKVLLTLVIIILEVLILCLCIAGSMLFNGFGFAYLFFIVLQLVICTLYRIQTVSWSEILVGILVFIIIGIYMYFNGNVVGEIEYFIGDAGGMQRHVTYEIYRWLTYIFDVLLSWFPIYNVLISPFWLRNSNSQHYFKQLIDKIKNTK